MASDTESQLIQVCITGDLPTLKNLITKQGLNPRKVKDPSGLTLLHLACKHGHLDITQYLIREQNCNPETLTSNGHTPLHIACKSGHLHIVQCLISEYKCNPHYTDNDGYTPLHAASESGDLDFIQRNKTSAMAARFNFSLQGTVFLIWQAFVRLLTILTQVLQRSTTTLSDPNNLLDQHRNASLKNQCVIHHLDVVKYLITEHNCSPQCTDNEGRMPLHYACASGKLEMVQYLLSDVSDLARTTKSGDTPLHIACKYNHVEVVKFLLSTGVSDPQCMNEQGLSPLNIATSVEIRELLDHHCKENHLLNSTVKVFILGDHLAGKSSLMKALQSNPGYLSSLVDRFRKVQGVKHQTVGIDSLSFSSNIFGNVVFYDFAGQREFHTSHAEVFSAHKIMGGVFVVVVNIAQSDDDICSCLHYWVSFIQDCSAHWEMMPHVILVGSHGDLADVDHAHKLLQRECSEHYNQLVEPNSIVCLDCTKSLSSGLYCLHSYLKESCDSIRKNGEKADQLCHAVHAYVRKTYTSVCVQGCTLEDMCTGLEGKSYLLPSDPVKLLPLFQILHDRGQVVFLKNDRDLVYSWIITNCASLLETVVGSTLFGRQHFKQHILQGSTGVIPRSTIGKAFPELNTGMIIRFLEHFQLCHQVNKHWTKLVQSPEEGTDDDDYYFFPTLTSSGKPNKMSPESSYYCGWFMHSSTKHEFFTIQFLHALLLRFAFQFAQPYHKDEDLQRTSKNKIPTLRRRCEMWKNGITWHDACGASTYFEVKDLKTVVLLVSFVKGSEIHSVKLRTTLIKTILLAKREFCPGVVVKECIMNSEVKYDELFQTVEECPHSVKYSLEYISDRISSRSAEDHPDVTLVNPDGSLGKQISEILYFEPYTLLSSDIITQLFSEVNTGRIVSDAFILKLANRLCLYNNVLVKILKLQPRLVSATLRRDTYALGRLDKTSKLRLQCMHILETWIQASESPATYKKLRRRLDKYSIFCGRNPLDLDGDKNERADADSLHRHMYLQSDDSGSEDREECGDHHEEFSSSDDQADRPTLAECVCFPGRERSILNIPQEIGTKYYEFGLFLLDNDRIKAIACKYMDDAEQINCEVLRQWIADKGKHPVTWKTLSEVLRDIELQTLAGEIEAFKCDEDSEQNLN